MLRSQRRTSILRYRGSRKIVQYMLKRFYLFLAQDRDCWLQSRPPFCRAGLDYIKHG